jgi:uncharacterized protein (DUF2249 family)
MKIEDYAIHMIDNLPIGEAIKVVSYYDSRPLTDETLKELGFEKAKTCYALKISSDVMLRCAIGQKFRNKKGLVYMNVMPSIYYKTVGSVKMLIEALKGDE